MGIGYDLIGFELKITEERNCDLLEPIEDMLHRGTLTPAYAGKLKGRLEHIATHFWWRFGRTF